MTKNFFPLTALLLSLVGFLVACGAASPPKDDKTAEIIPLQSIVVLPVQCAAADTNPEKCQELAAGADIIENLLQQYLEQNSRKKEINFIASQKMEALLGNMHGDIISQARHIAQELKSDGVLLVTISRFQERVGSNRSASSSASVAFDYKLIDMTSGSVLCSGAFDETQQALTENLLHFGKALRRGFKWITAEQLAQEGIIAKFSQCPYLTSSEE